MAEELQNLLDRIQKQGVERAEAEAERIRAAAGEEAERLVAEARQAADAARKKAEADRAAIEARGRTALAQAARDVILAVGEALQAALERIVRDHVSAALDDGTLKQMLGTMVEAYCRAGEGPSGIEVLLEPEQRERLAADLSARFTAVLRDGLDIKPDRTLSAGFRISRTDDEVEHDFSAAAIAESLCRILRPRLAEIVAEAAQSLTRANAEPRPDVPAS